MERISFAGQVAVVTGSGRGIGRAHAIELARRGAAVVVNDVDPVSADAVQTEILRSGGSACTSYADVSTEDGALSLIHTALDRFADIDIVINNAGSRRGGLFGDLSADDINTVLDSHLRAAFFVTAPAWRIMRKKGQGRIIMTSSSAGLFSSPGLSNYAAAKAGLYGLTKALAYEGAPYGITVNAILPYASTAGSSQHTQNVAGIEEYRRPTSIDGVGKIPKEAKDPALVAHLVAYLVSRECNISGEAFSVCNGRYARVFVGIADGWLARNIDSLDAEKIASHIDEIRDLSKISIPMWLHEEVSDVVRRISAS